MEKNNKEELIKLIQENPELPLVFMISNDEVAEDYGSTVYEYFTAHKSEVYKYERYGDLIFSDDERYVIEYYCDYFGDEEKYKDLSDEEYEKVIKEYVNTNVEHYKAIVLYVN